jgi:hypothetical protein
MTGFTRKNLMVDADRVRELARQRGMSESQAVREAVEFALAAEEINAAIRALHDRGSLDDGLGRLPDEVELHSTGS